MTHDTLFETWRISVARIDRRNQMQALARQPHALYRRKGTGNTFVTAVSGLLSGIAHANV
jgi:hypothetical protein